APASQDPLFVSTPKNFGIGQDIQLRTDLTCFVKWPKYIRLQRQKVILHQRLKVSPEIAQFSHTLTLDKNTTTQLLKLLNKYRPETKLEKKGRLEATARRHCREQGRVNQGLEEAPLRQFGLNHTVALIEAKKVSLITKPASAPFSTRRPPPCSPSSVKSEDTRELATIVSATKANLYVWGGGLCGNKLTSMLRKRAKASEQTISAATVSK
ncbi:hypothetical protein C8R44DRAFT_899915, partial [Mycena epipterygia]